MNINHLTPMSSSHVIAEATRLLTLDRNKGRPLRRFLGQVMCQSTMRQLFPEPAHFHSSKRESLALRYLIAQDYHARFAPEFATVQDKVKPPYKLPQFSIGFLMTEVDAERDTICNVYTFGGLRPETATVPQLGVMLQVAITIGRQMQDFMGENVSAYTERLTPLLESGFGEVRHAKQPS